MKIVICGDIVPTESNMNLFKQAEIEKLIGIELSTLLNNSDVCVCNLETPTIDFLNPIDKCGPNLAAKTESLNALSFMGITAVNLANNHILDQGNSGLKKTIDELEKRGLSYFGAGMNVSLADSCYFYTDGNIKVGVYGIAEHEFSIATETSAGANPYDPLYTFDRIKNIKQKCDYLILLYHGGIEEYRYPSPNLQKVCRKFVESGANFVVCQHSHCIGCEENYKGGTIIYGQGNFIFDRKNNDYWKSGLLIKLEISDTDVFKEYVPIIKCAEVVKLANREQKREIMSGFYNRSNLIIIDGYIKKEYEFFSQKKIMQYLTSFGGRRNLMKKMLIRVLGYKFIRFNYRKNDYIRMQNYIECEAHSELFLTGLKYLTQRED